MTLWICCDCDHEVVADRRPSPMRWSDGHVCHFEDSTQDNYSFDAWLKQYTNAECAAKVHPQRLAFFQQMYEECSSGPWGQPDEIMDATSGCSCDQLPEFDMDGSRFDGLCDWCTAQLKEAHGVNQEWPPGAPKYH